MNRSDVDAMRAAHKAAMDLAAKNAVLFWTWPLVVYSACILAFPRKQ